MTIFQKNPAKGKKKKGAMFRPSEEREDTTHAERRGEGKKKKNQLPKIEPDPDMKKKKNASFYEMSGKRGGDETGILPTCKRRRGGGMIKNSTWKGVQRERKQFKKTPKKKKRKAKKLYKPMRSGGQVCKKRGGG